MSSHLLFHKGILYRAQRLQSLELSKQCETLLPPEFLGSIEIPVTFGNRNYHACETIESL